MKIITLLWLNYAICEASHYLWNVTNDIFFNTCKADLNIAFKSYFWSEYDLTNILYFKNLEILCFNIKYSIIIIYMQNL